MITVLGTLPINAISLLAEAIYATEHREIAQNNKQEIKIQSNNGYIQTIRYENIPEISALQIIIVGRNGSIYFIDKQRELLPIFNTTYKTTEFQKWVKGIRYKTKFGPYNIMNIPDKENINAIVHPLQNATTYDIDAAVTGPFHKLLTDNKTTVQFTDDSNGIIHYNNHQIMTFRNKTNRKQPHANKLMFTPVYNTEYSGHIPRIIIQDSRLYPNYVFLLKQLASGYSIDSYLKSQLTTKARAGIAIKKFLETIHTL